MDFVNTRSVEYFGVLFKSLRWYHTEESKKEPSACAAAWAHIVMHRDWARRPLGKGDSDPQENVNLTRKLKYRVILIIIAQYEIASTSKELLFTEQPLRNGPASSSKARRMPDEEKKSICVCVRYD